MNEDPLTAIVELRIVANRLRQALHDLAYNPDDADCAEYTAAIQLLEELAQCQHCGQMDVGHDALHGFAP